MFVYGVVVKRGYLVLISSVRPYYCNKVLPLVYDNSLSYYENLCKLTYKVNEVIDSINSDFENIIQAKVDEYFNSIMMDAIYNEETETITLSKEIVADGYHKYVVDTKTIEVE